MARRTLATVAAVGVALLSALSFAAPHAGATPAGSAPSLGADLPITGDWDGNGTTTIGVVRPSGFLLRNTNDAGAVNVAASFGLPTDVPITGDWDGNGTTTVGVFRDGTWFLRDDNSSGVADASFDWGLAGDVPITGDWDGNGTTTIGVFRTGVWYLRNTNSAGPPDLSFGWGLAGDVAITGDWDGNDTTTIGVFREGMWFLRNTNAIGGVDASFGWGSVGDVAITGDWDGNGTTTIGVRRGENWFLRNTNVAGGVDASFPWGLSPTPNPQGRALALDGAVAYGTASDVGLFRYVAATGATTYTNAVGQVKDALLAGGALIVAAQSPDTGAGELLWLDPTTLVVLSRVALIGVAPVTRLAAAGNVVWGVAGANVVGYNVVARTRIATPDLSFLPPHAAVGVDAYSDVAVDATGTNLYASASYGGGSWAVARYSATTGTLQAANTNAGSGPGGSGVLSAEARGVWFSFPTGTVNASLLLRATDLVSVLQAAPTGDVGRLNTHIGEVLWTTQAASLQLVCLDPTTGNPVAGANVSPITFAHDAAGGESPTRFWLRVAPAASCPRLR